MKRKLALLLLTVLFIFPAGAEERSGSDAQYTAKSRIAFYLFTAPGGGDTVDEVPENARVQVLELGEEWSLIGYYGKTGWGRTGWLWEVRSLDAAKYPVPNARPACGVVTALDTAALTGGDFSGLTVAPGTLLCATAAGEGEYTLPVWRGETEVTADLFAYSPFAPCQEAQPGDLIAGFTTYYNERTGGSMAESRAHNIILGCERLHGVILEPGAEFSFNAVCAPYSQFNGYLVAPNISSSGRGYGGGVCQVSTTLYNALLGTPLQITAWATHRYTGVQYVPQFFDAAVGAYSDLKFVNTLPYPVRIEAMPQNGAITVLLSRAE